MNDVDSFWCRHCGSRLLPRSEPACIVCGGNVARAERLKIALGTRTVYFGCAHRLNSPAVEMGIFRVNLMLRFRRAGQRPLPRAVLDWLCDEIRDSLDAPEEIPAGSVLWVPVPDAADPGEDPELCGYSAQRIVMRDGSEPDPV